MVPFGLILTNPRVDNKFCLRVIGTSFLYMRLKILERQLSAHKESNVREYIYVVGNEQDIIFKY